jgi:hypothetical protein
MSRFERTDSVDPDRLELLSHSPYFGPMILVLGTAEAVDRQEAGVDNERLLGLLEVARTSARLEAETGHYPSPDEIQAELDRTAELPS